MEPLSFTQDELKEILDKHNKWLNEEDGGERADLSRANLSRVDLSGADLSRANLSRVDLSGADLSGADLFRANLSRANLSRAYLSRAYLSGADLFRANLSRADLSGADLSFTNVIGFYAGRHFGFLHENVLKIGCECYELKEFLLKLNEIGKDNRYSEMEIENYRIMIEAALKVQENMRRMQENKE